MHVALAILLLTIGQPVKAGWTFCVAESAGGKQIWISGVFRAAGNRLRLETDFKSVLRAHGISDSVVQCPAPSDDKTEAENSQFIATEFHRRMGDTVHAIMASEFKSRR